MKRVKFMLSCLESIIKKKIFKYQIADFSFECEKILANLEETNATKKKMQEEYLLNYRITTRWQTL